MATTQAIANSTLVFRIFTLLFLVASIVLLVTDNFTFGDLKRSFKDVIAYRYVLSTAVIGAAYTLLQFPFAIYYAHTEKRMIRNAFLPEFDFYADKVISFLLATGVGAGFAVSFELKAFLDDLFDDLIILGFSVPDEFRSKTNKFLDRGNIATTLLFGGFICMAVLSMISSIYRLKGRGLFR